MEQAGRNEVALVHTSGRTHTCSTPIVWKLRSCRTVASTTVLTELAGCWWGTHVADVSGVRRAAIADLVPLRAPSDEVFQLEPLSWHEPIEVLEVDDLLCNGEADQVGPDASRRCQPFIVLVNDNAGAVHDDGLLTELVWRLVLREWRSDCIRNLNTSQHVARHLSAAKVAICG